MPLAEFLRTFCLDKIRKKTCVRGDKLQRIENW